MAIKHFNGIGFGTESGALFYSISETGAVITKNSFVEVPPPTTLDLSSLDYAPWGTDNRHPLKLKSLIDDCGELQAIIKAKATFGINRGILPVQGQYNEKGEFEVLRVVDDEEVEDFIENSNLYDTVYSLLKDRYGYGQFVGRALFNDARDKIVRIRRDDITELRLKKMNAKHIVDYAYLCAEWDRVVNADDDRIVKVRLLNRTDAMNDLKSIAESQATQFAFIEREPDWNTKYYSDPDWYAARDWVNINIGVPKMKAAMYENNMRPKFIVYIHEAFWDKFIYVSDEGGQAKAYTDKEKKELRDQFYSNIDQYLSGTKNAYKSIFTEYFVDPTSGKEVKYILIEPVEDKSIDGELLKDSSTSGSMISFSMAWNPAISGGNLPSGPYTNSQGGSNVRESTLLQVMMAEPERQSILNVLNIVARFNGWKKRFPGFRWIISSTIPTTLDTGGSSKPAVEGVPGAK